MSRLYALLSKKAVYHGLSWLMYISFFVAWQLNAHAFWFVLTNEILKFVFVGAAVYFNLFYLLPNYLSNKKYFQYFISLIFTGVLITPLEVFALFWKIGSSPDLQYQLVSNQGTIYIFNIFILLGSTLLKIISDWLRHQRVRNELQREKLEAELNFLKAQINPHFLFNTLNSLYALTLKKSDAAPEIVLKLSEMMRYMLYETNEVLVPLQNEWQYLKNYIDLEQLRLGHRSEVHFLLNGDIQYQRIAPFLLATFVENAFKHGVGQRLADSRIDIELTINATQLHFSCTNNKPEIAPQIVPKGIANGIGLVNVRRRLDLLYPNKYELIINSEAKMYSVFLDLQL